MAVFEQTFDDLALSVGGNILYCSNSIGLDMTTDEIEAACKRAGSYKNSKPGSQSATAKADGLMTFATDVDAAENVTSENIVDLWQNKTIVALTFGSDKPGGAKYAANAFITSVSLSAGVGANGTYSASFRIELPLVKTINPAN